MAGILLDSPLRPDQAEMVSLIQASAEELLGLLGNRPEPTGPATGGIPALSDHALHLLLAEDDPANQMVDLTLLARLGHIVETVSDGAEALARLADGDYDAVILDCQMPQLDGFETARRIRSGAVPRLNPQIPIIALTAYIGKADRDRCLAAGMNDCLSKPLNPAQMNRCGLGPAMAAAPLSPPSFPVLDISLLQTMRATPGQQGTTLLDDFVALFLRDEPRRVAELRQLAAQSPPAELARMAHTVGGSCAMMGAKQMQQAALALEAAVNSGTPAAVALALDRIDTAWAALRDELRTEGFDCP
jgi:two-component system sensor histidine kinase/response regulator